MNQTAILFGYILYLLFFAWVGWRRGQTRELWVLIFAVGLWFVIKEQGEFFVRLANLGGKVVAFLGSGGLGEDSTAAFEAIAATPSVITADTRQGYLYIIYVALTALVYILTNRFIKDSRNNGWAMMFGLFNGLIFASIFVPPLVTLLFPQLVNPQAADAATAQIFSFDPLALQGAPLLQLIGSSITLLLNTVRELWRVVEPNAQVVFLVLIVALLVFAASTLRATKPKPK